MSSRTGRQRLHRWGSVAVMAIGVLLAPQIASATIGDAIGDPVNAVTGAANDAVGQVTGAANDATGQVTGTANDATGQVTGTANDAAGQVTGTANDAAGQVTGTANDAVGQVTGTANDAVGQVADTAQTNAAPVTSGRAGTGPSSSQGAGSVSRDPTGQGSIGGSASRGGPSASGWLGRAALRASESGSMPGGGLDTRSDDEVTSGDPCDADQSLVCLGLLYGLGDFADVGAKVIASLAQTGVGVIGLAALALLLAIAGSSAVAASSRRMAPDVLPAD
jgi:uncharacterized protein YjbJ (UPF0337 family)